MATSLTAFYQSTDMNYRDTAQGRGGGLLVYSRTGVVVTKMDNNVTFTQYCCFKVYDVTFYLVYRSPNATEENMNKLIELVKTVEKDSVLIGDFNLPEVDWEMGETTRRSRDLVEVLDDQLLVQMVDFPTHIKGNVLDLVLTNIPERVTEINDNGRLGSSDHTMLMVSVQVGRVQQPAKKVKNLRKADWDKMREDMRGVDWKRAAWSHNGLHVDSAQEKSGSYSEKECASKNGGLPG